MIVSTKQQRIIVVLEAENKKGEVRKKIQCNAFLRYITTHAQPLNLNFISINLKISPISVCRVYRKCSLNNITTGSFGSILRA